MHNGEISMWQGASLLLLGQWRVGQPIVVKQCDFHMMEAMGDGNSQNDPSTEDPLLSLPPLLSPIIMA